MLGHKQQKCDRQTDRQTDRWMVGQIEVFALPLHHTCGWLKIEDLEHINQNTTNKEHDKINKEKICVTLLMIMFRTYNLEIQHFL